VETAVACGAVAILGSLAGMTVGSGVRNPEVVPAIRRAAIRFGVAHVQRRTYA